MQSLSKDDYERLVGPSSSFSMKIGNTLTANVWFNLLSLIESTDLSGKTVAMCRCAPT